MLSGMCLGGLRSVQCIKYVKKAVVHGRILPAGHYTESIGTKVSLFFLCQIASNVYDWFLIANL